MTIEIDCAFPGGNIVVDGIAADCVRLHQDLRDTVGNWFYWCFRARGAAGCAVRFQFTGSRALGVRGPAVSLDGGDTWAWLGAAAVSGGGFTYAFAPDPPRLDGGGVRFSFGMPYQESHWRRFAQSFAGNPFVSFHALCHTAKGRAVEYALVGRLDDGPAQRVAVTCRHHCCEMMASYAVEGLIDRIAGGADPQAQWLRENVQLLIVPFVDKDGVEDGDQGKNRAPRDHNRDYAGRSLYAETAAIRALLPRWSDGQLRVALDLHCPHIAGANNETIYQVGSFDARVAREQLRFAEFLESACQGPLRCPRENVLPFGVGWNTRASESVGCGFARWAQELPGVRFASTIEIAYANANGVEVNQQSARLFGRDLAAALAAYLSANG